MAVKRRCLFLVCVLFAGGLVRVFWRRVKRNVGKVGWIGGLFGCWSR